MSKDRLIQVQKPAQSLEHFTKKYEQGAESVGLLKPILIGLGVLAVAGLGYGVYDLLSTRSVERFEGNLAQLVVEVEGNDPAKQLTPAEVQQRMRERLPRMEALANSAPSSRRSVAQGMLAAWKLYLDGQGAAPGGDGPWGKLQSAERAIALGKAADAQQQLAGLGRKADPGVEWADAYWLLQLQADAMSGASDQARAHAADYRERFKGVPTNPEVLRLAERL